MQIVKSVVQEGHVDHIREGTRAYFLGENYTELQIDKEQLRFCKHGAVKVAMNSKIESLPTVLDVRLIPQVDRDGHDLVVLTLNYEVKMKFRLVSRIDTLFFDLETEALQEYLETGKRSFDVGRLNDVRNPIAITAFGNALLTAFLIGAAGLLIGAKAHVIFPIALGISLITYVSIIGFADIIVDGMDQLKHKK